MTDARVVFVSAPDAATAAKIGRQLVDERLVACATIVPAATSIYRWKGAVEEQGEAVLMLKTVAARVAALEERVRALHPYETPEVLAVAVEGGSAPYLRWLSDETR